ncbi:MAG: hypothetical protein HDKAJFGB_02966 [Anaerolineae bacterium]|nr:hypothetical protein [Anaerolineae bacterium]
MTDEHDRHISVGGDLFKVTIDGHAGQVAVGKNIIQVEQGKDSSQMSQNDLKQLLDLLEDLRTRIALTDSSEEKRQALHKLSEFEVELTSKKPNLASIELVMDWLQTNLPSMLPPAISETVHSSDGSAINHAVASGSSEPESGSGE